MWPRARPSRTAGGTVPGARAQGPPLPPRGGSSRLKRGGAEAGGGALGPGPSLRALARRAPLPLGLSPCHLSCYCDSSLPSPSRSLSGRPCPTPHLRED